MREQAAGPKSTEIHRALTLMKAAPQMLDALKRADAFLHATELEHESEEALEVVTLLRKAIAKAEGK